MELSAATAVLARAPDLFDTLLGELDNVWVHRNDGAGTWSGYDILGHLLYGEQTDWMPRVRMILEHGTSRTFDSFDRAAMLGAGPVPVDLLLARFRSARLGNLTDLSTMDLTEADLERQGRHPEFGEVTLGQLIAAWVAHDLTHLAQATEVMARHYRDDVGPWRAYLPALDRVSPAE